MPVATPHSCASRIQDPQREVAQGGIRDETTIARCRGCRRPRCWRSIRGRSEGTAERHRQHERHRRSRARQFELRLQWIERLRFRGFSWASRRRRCRRPPTPGSFTAFRKARQAYSARARAARTNLASSDDHRWPRVRPGPTSSPSASSRISQRLHRVRVRNSPSW